MGHITGVFLVGHFILVLVFIQSTNISNHFNFILVANVNFSHSFSFSRRKYVILILVVFLFQIITTIHGRSS